MLLTIAMHSQIVAVVILSLATLAYGFSVRADAEACNATNCVKEDGCYCASSACPYYCTEIPQFVVLAFDDALTDAIYTNYLEELLFNRVNPDGNNIGATFYVPHEYTDYERVNQLYNRGFEIAVHSISKNAQSEYWQEASVEDLTAEFGGQRTIISTFANIPDDDIIGARTPNFALAGDKTFEAYQDSGIQYDSSWPARNSNPLYPYSLDYLSSQECLIGTCPTSAFPGFFVLPIINLVGTYAECNNLLGCSINGDVNEVSDWLWDQYQAIHTSNNAPITLNINSAWFLVNPDSLDGLKNFLDRVAAETENVYFVSHKQVVDWMKNPVFIPDYKTEVVEHAAPCTPRTCVLAKEDETRYMKSCVACPSVYPWLGNPTGNN